ncbi:hypothetical protein JKG47_10035 [Acidithiobacillus sp. MC6.1]|nr:hypothetical protein [Acidithiobacillus sp. MC6.1]
MSAFWLGINEDGNSSKFYVITGSAKGLLSGAVRAFYGRIRHGAAGMQTHDYLLGQFPIKVNEKVRKGYREVDVTWLISLLGGFQALPSELAEALEASKPLHTAIARNQPSVSAAPPQKEAPASKKPSVEPKSNPKNISPEPWSFRSTEGLTW